MSSGISARIDDFAERVDPADIILGYDVRFDIPLRHTPAIGTLHVTGAYAGEQGNGPTVRVGSFWCDVVRADVEYQLQRGLHLVSESRPLANTLAKEVRAAPATTDSTGLESGSLLSAYAAARWFDGAGKINYRVGNYAQARGDFAIALELAERQDLWWCRPDLISNKLRGELEESRQSNQDMATGRTWLEHLLDHIRDLRAEVDHVRARAETTLAQGPQGPQDADDAARTREWELVRGYDSLLHNLSVALETAAKAADLWKPPRAEAPRPDQKNQQNHQNADVTEPDLAPLDTSGVAESADKALADSLKLSRRSAEVAGILGDGYRRAQALLHQAQVLGRTAATRPEAAQIYQDLMQSPWLRGRRMARQNYAKQLGGQQGRHMLSALIDEFQTAGIVAGHQAGMDIDYADWTMRLYAQVIADLREHLGADEWQGYKEDLQNKQRKLSETVRQVIALPAYKNAYNKAIYPVFLNLIGEALRAPAAPGKTPDQAAQLRAERVLNLAEESAARSLLDLMASTSLPTLALAPANVPTTALTPIPTPVSHADHRSLVPTGLRGRRGVTLRALDLADSRLPQVLRARQQEFESAFLATPLEATPHDEDVAHKLNMLTANDRGCCVVRFMSYSGQSDKREWAAVVGYGGRQELVTDFDSAAIRQLVDRLAKRSIAPQDGHCTQIWRLLVAPVWDWVLRAWESTAVLLERRHLILVPSDELLQVPFHVATEQPWIKPPLGAIVPMSYAVSVTTLISLGRHLLKVQPVDRTDDLAAVMSLDLDAQTPGLVSGQEIVGVDWPANQTYVVGEAPEGVPAEAINLEDGWAGLGQLTELQPEFFVYAGHGEYDAGFSEFGPALRLPGVGADYLTSFDAALRMRLPRNRLTLIGACLAGRGAAIGGNDVGGFLRALMAAGAGAIGIPLWSIDDREMVLAGRTLLRASRKAAEGEERSFDVVRTLHEHYLRQFETAHGQVPQPGRAGYFADLFPLALYL